MAKIRILGMHTEVVPIPGNRVLHGKIPMLSLLLAHEDKDGADVPRGRHRHGTVGREHLIGFASMAGQ